MENSVLILCVCMSRLVHAVDNVILGLSVRTAL